MILKNWESLPCMFQTAEVRPYYELLRKKGASLAAKRAFDLCAAALLLVLLAPVFAGIALAIRLDSKGEILFRQTRVTQYGREFSIYKFRTMIPNAERFGAQLTTKEDQRITQVGHFLRKCRLDELPQLLNILKGEMSFVGTRPEVPAYVSAYSPQMWATLLLPAGVTSKASIAYKEEDKLLEGAENVAEAYLSKVLPQKMQYNLEYLREFRLVGDIQILLQTLRAVFFL